MRELPVKIKPGSDPGVGSVFGVDVAASKMRLLVNELNPKDSHPEFKPLGGVRVETRVVLPMNLQCTAVQDRRNELITVKGDFLKTKNIKDILSKFYDPKDPWRVLIKGVDGNKKFLESTTQVVTVAEDGTFTGSLKVADKNLKQIACLFAGTTELGSAASGYVDVK